MLDLLSRQLGRKLNPARLAVPSGERVEVDGADADRSILVECWAHQGPPKSAQRHKVLADAFKLTWISTTMYPKPRLILCLSDPLAAAPFLPGARSWAARAFQDLGVTISVVDLPADLRQNLLQAQRRHIGNRGVRHPDREYVVYPGPSGNVTIRSRAPDFEWHRNRRSVRQP